jgi:NNP family nitrate/nitrite transporter-like MFS transporter
VLAGFLMKGTGDVRQTLLILGGAVLVSSVCAIGVRFSSAAVDTAAPAAA